MATARTIPTRDEWDARAVELAEDAHLTGTARLLAENTMHAIYAVRKSGPVGEYLVRVERWYGGELRSVSCDCQAGAYGKACKHAGAVLHTLKARERAMAQPDTDPLANWRRGGEW
jgi:hypothetical protein